MLVAIWRVTRLLVVDEWPPTRALREWIVQAFADVAADGKVVRGRWGGVGLAVAYLWTCQWCMSVWVGAWLVSLTTVYMSVPAPWLVVAAGSCVAGVMSWVEAEHEQRWQARDAARADREGARR